MAALATPLNLQAIVIAEHEDPDELLLIGAARSCVLAVVAAMALLCPSRSASDTATADTALGACVLCLFTSLLGVLLPSLRDVREGTAASTLSSSTTSLGGGSRVALGGSTMTVNSGAGAGGLGGDSIAPAARREGRTPPPRPTRLGGDALRLLDPVGALPPRSRPRVALPEPAAHGHGRLRQRAPLCLWMHAAYACLSTASLLATPLHLGRWLGLASLLLLSAAQLADRCAIADAALAYAIWLVLPLSILAGTYRACTSCALLSGLGLILLAELARAAAAAAAAPPPWSCCSACRSSCWQVRGEIGKI
jgi:hypothetical protein